MAAVEKNGDIYIIFEKRATSEPLSTGSDIALARLWTRSHQSHLGLKWFLAHNYTPTHEPPDETPITEAGGQVSRRWCTFFARGMYRKRASENHGLHT